MSTRLSIATLLVALPLACAEGQHYDSATRGSGTLPTVGVSQGSGADDSDSDADSDSDSDTDPSGPGPGEVTSESNGSDATGETSDSSDPTTGGPSSGNMTWTTTGSGGTTDDGCGGPCDAPPSPCFDAVGECSDSQCLYYPLDAGAPCDDGDPCTAGDACDGDGACAGGEAITCDPPANATGGTCVNGACEGFTCKDPWENCDGSWDNGCEVPTGIANQCDMNGLNPDGGCWTAYCGSSNAENATNFGTYFCASCSTCHVPAEGMAQWCNHDSGNWYEPEVNTCGMWKDLLCEEEP
ncbi:MAG: hypothetical protein R3A79_30760 [Nannocystaceae bacterium]